MKHVDLPHNFIMNLLEQRTVTLTQILDTHLSVEYLTRPLGTHVLQIELPATNMFESEKAV